MRGKMFGLGLAKSRGIRQACLSYGALLMVHLFSTMVFGSSVSYRLIFNFGMLYLMIPEVASIQFKVYCNVLRAIFWLTSLEEPSRSSQA